MEGQVWNSSLLEKLGDKVHHQCLLQPSGGECVLDWYCTRLVQDFLEHSTCWTIWFSVGSTDFR